MRPLEHYLAYRVASYFTAILIGLGIATWPIWFGLSIEAWFMSIQNFDLSTVDLIIRDIAELPDRTSPSDQPEMMLVTEDELRVILERYLTEK